MSNEAPSTNNKNNEEHEGEPSFWNMLAEKFEADDWRELARELKEILLEVRKARLAEKKSLSWPVFLLIAVIFASVAILAWDGRIEGHYVTTMGGVIVGYMLSFLEVSFSPSD